ncbi:MAG TPA: hypothetical protein O0X70_01525 [Methanocorpusculum sp.]|nr:hypothetical protein [Methanocorpusculum sp.]
MTFDPKKDECCFDMGTIHGLINSPGLHFVDYLFVKGVAYQDFLGVKDAVEKNRQSDNPVPAAKQLVDLVGDEFNWDDVVQNVIERTEYIFDLCASGKGGDEYEVRTMDDGEDEGK